jgi:UDP-N-acetylglucosamine:LPS N-acetylglucosamine transferase
VTTDFDKIYEMKKVLIYAGVEGHLSIAQACKQALEKAGFKTKLSIPDSLKTFDLYIPIYRYFPSLLKIPYKLGEDDQVQKLIKSVLSKKISPKIKKEVKKVKPDLIVSSYFWLNYAIDEVIDYQVKKIPFINIIANPWKIHPLEFSSFADLNIVYDEKGVWAGLKNNVNEKALFPLGWLIRDEFYKDYDVEKIRKGLGFKKDIFTILVCGGSEGTNMILKIIPAILGIKKSLQVMVVCGTNNVLYNNLKALKNLLPKRKKRIDLKLLKYTNDLAQLMSVSDLVIGKAGPNLIFESVACKKPFMAICNISHEDANLEIIRKKNLGLVEKNTFRVIKRLKSIINKPNILNRYHASIEKERNNNLQAPEKLVDAVKNLINE